MLSHDTHMASLRAIAGVARPRAAAPLATGSDRCAAYAPSGTWQHQVSPKPATAVFHTDANAPRPWELSP